MKTILNLVVIFSLSAFTALAQETTSAEELAKKLANPVASLISLPFQNNSDFGIGEEGGSRNTLNIQPVIPFKLNEKLNLITRWVFPVITQYSITAPGEKQSGTADAVLSAFLSPAEPAGGVIYGVGPVFLAPVASEELFATEQFGAGPTAVALTQKNGWTVGALVNQIWKISGDDDKPEVNQFYALPFVNYNWKSGAGIGANSDFTYQWDNEVSTAFINITASGITKFEKQTVQFSIGPRIQVSGPDNNRADFGIRSAIVFLFPR